MENHEFTITIPEKYREGIDPTRVQSYLEQDFFTIISVSLVDPETMMIVTPDNSTEQAIKASLLSFANQKTAFEQKVEDAQADAWPLIKAIWNKPRGDRTNVEKAILGIAATVYESRLDES